MSSVKKYAYTSLAGDHWPDADKGDDLVYALDLSCWLDNEAANLVSVTWTVPDNVTITDNYVEGDRAYVKLYTPVVGAGYKILAAVTTTQAGKTQINNAPMMLKVF